MSARAVDDSVAAAADLHDPVFVNATVLIADDHPPNLVLLERILSRAGASKIHVTTDPRQTVDMYKALRPDLVLLDLHMPEMDGVAVMEAMARLTPEDDFVPVIVLTADATQAARERVLAAGANDFLTKPVDRTEVLLRTRNLLHTRLLHTGIRQHNSQLRREIDERTAAERQAATELADRRCRIQRLLVTDAVRVVFQPIVDLESGAAIGYEALARFDEEPSQPPNVWFEQAAQVGLGAQLELAALRAALSQLDAIPDDAFLTLNLSPAAAMTDEVAELLGQYPSERLVLEITEHARIDDYDSLTASLRELGDTPVRLAVDDAGAGFASLQHILRLCPDIIKLDIALVRGIDQDPIKRALASSLVNFGHEIGSTLIAEGIETAAELETLVGLGVGCGQGYHIGRPAELPDAPR